MQKYKLWIMIGLILLCLIALVLWLSPESKKTTTHEQTQIAQAENLTLNPNTITNHGDNSFVSSSQQDIEINCQVQLDASHRLVVNEQTRNCFEFFITQYGEKSIDQIQQDFKKFTQQQYQDPAQSQILDLWTRYIQYRQALGELTPPVGLNQEDPKYYRAIHQNTQNLRKKFFSDYETEGLFGTEDVYHEYTLERMSILADQNLSEIEKAKKLKTLLEDLPQDWQENLEQLNKLEDLRKLTADIKANGGSSADIREMRLNLVGAEATTRLETLDLERNTWKTDVTSYLNARDSIVKSGLSDLAKQQAVEQLRQQHFKIPEQQLRIQTFEQVHDQGGKLPFPD